jgi:mycothiol synthase
VAKALMARSLAALKAEHIAIATLGVDVQNPTGALRLYEGMGFHKTVSMAGYRKLIAPSEPKARATENIG